VQVKALALALLSGCTIAAVAGPSTEPTTDPAAAAETVAAADAAAAEAAAAAADPVAVPGGRLSRDPRTCDAAADHCLRPETWFLERTVGTMRRIDAVFWADGAWRRWSSGAAVAGGPAHRTRPATLDDLAVGAPVIFVMSGRVPANESEAHHAWALETIHSIDLGDETFEWGRGSAGTPVGLARVIVETR
jgi:hypothetical protein